MLGKTAGGLFWMFRSLERSENIARLLEVGFRLALTHTHLSDEGWESVLTTAGALENYHLKYDTIEASHVIDFLLRDRSNPSSIIQTVENARNNARSVRTALTREMWEVTNENWINLKALLAKPVRVRELPDILATIRRQNSLVQGTLQGTMFRDDAYDFARIGTFLERADNTARILDVKYYVLLPSIFSIGSQLDNVQWETILRTVSAHSTYSWLYGGEISPRSIADFLILDRRLPRSLAFCYSKTSDHMLFLSQAYGDKRPSLEQSTAINDELKHAKIDDIFDSGLHEFIESFIRKNNSLGLQIEKDYRFYE